MVLSVDNGLGNWGCLKAGFHQAAQEFQYDGLEEIFELPACRVPLPKEAVACGTERWGNSGQQPTDPR